MKLRVLFLKKKHIYILLLILVFLILTLMLFIKKQPAQTFSSMPQTETIKSDFDGDGNKKDTLYLKKMDSKYCLQIKTENKLYDIAPSSSCKTISDVCNYWPVHITLMDVSRDKISEIFVQGCIKDKPIEYVFSWNTNKFENIFSNSNNILGFIDCKNNKTPKVISGKFVDGNIYTYNYICLDYKFKNYNYETNQTFMGKDSICAFINFIQGLPQNKDYIPRDIFSMNIVDKEFDLISDMASQNNSYVFQDAIFKETKCTNKGDASEVLWKLSFKGISNTDKNSIKNYTMSLTLTADPSSDKKYYFKISSMSLI
ncbi:VCBS repeat-containing protein [Clostridium sp. JN-1]|uniref:VCBS repeat-containing protein n=1 Tax=Clostridium sp. JN-1 TaxID=2483110 RepID=UPI000F0B19B6|nr:VCBS repeat-containing protein [Clostridium sp. JN-1]